ncbi:hypothetical protein LV457_13535 [Mycobacterium sp. MYCO198283]|uniref:hypothetical protein n=1 Tax=Mycobacterium sp. MYCO198283 TaxID=2883505 RepID=UPI001E29FDB9|nr:hypothetical protein [Mycobacterium sp. MYCO198283]MCG5433300.1 hypothetical protein [Mycobacterium sp. MYCO198283]
MSEHSWQVVVARRNDPGNPADGAAETTLVSGTEAEARRVYADETAAAAERGYDSVRLRRGGDDVESWPPETGWTV